MYFQRGELDGKCGAELGGDSQTVGNSHQGLYVKLLQFADFCPVLILALLAGVILDRVNRKTWLIILQAAAVVLGARLAVAAFLRKATTLS